MSRCKQLVLVFILLCAAPSLIALPLVTFSDAKLIFESRERAEHYRLGLGSIEKINSRWSLEREQRLSGDLARQTFEISEENSAEEVFEYYRQQLLQVGGRELFYCRSRSCGSSNAWANSHFHIKQLYGLDSEQYYSAFEVIAADDTRFYVSLYGVRRGNKRNYLQVDVLETVQAPRISSSVEAIIERLEEGRSISFVDAFLDGGQLDEQYLMSLVSVFTRQPGWSIGLVGHNYAVQSFALQEAEAAAMVARVKDQLLEKGIAASRIKTFALGGLVPAVRIGKREILLQIVRIAP